MPNTFGMVFKKIYFFNFDKKIDEVLEKHKKINTDSKTVKLFSHLVTVNIKEKEINFYDYIEIETIRLINKINA